ncbi:MAG: hypothetical protein J7M26_01405 [Armatimonadetes bacterium]|nr:hypothetical protein [Armatimonadota bacterium]
MQAYHAALALAMAVLAASGYRARGPAHHVTLFEALPLVMGEDVGAISEYLDVCRQKRHQALYGKLGQVTETQVREIVEVVRVLGVTVRSWLAAYRPELDISPG